MNIRDMRTEDYPMVDDMMQQLHRIHVEGRPDLYVPMEHPYSPEDYEKLITGDNICLIAEKEGAAIGICFVSMKKRTCMVNRRTAYMEDLFVVENERRKGVAKALFHAAEDRARETGAERLDLMVWNFNENALGFYRALGMTPQRYILEKPL